MRYLLAMLGGILAFECAFAFSFMFIEPQLPAVFHPIIRVRPLATDVPVSLLLGAAAATISFHLALRKKSGGGRGRESFPRGRL